ncbi:MAG: dTDP-4-dehydrorhamnose 3,5-epimerase [Anaerolineales bacterium]
MKLTGTEINGVLRINPEIHEDSRGFFYECYNRDDFTRLGIDSTFVQDNQSGSKHGVLRGLHYQIRHPQGKLIRTINGEIFDVAVDMRRSSKTFGSWYGTTLSAANRHMLWVPPGFAHGFYTLSDWAEVLYKVTDFYSPEWERTLIWNDPSVGIEWPLKDGRQPILSPKDEGGATLHQAEAYS